MTIPSLTLPPGDVPIRSNFASDALYSAAVDAWMAWWEGVPAEQNAMAAAMDAAVAAAVGAATGTILGTSTTSLAVGTGSKVFTTQSGKNWIVGSFVIAASAADPANYMYGQVTAYSGTSLTVNVTQTGGSGTLANWNISLASPQVPSGYSQLGSTITTTGAASITANLSSFTNIGDLLIVVESLSHNSGGAADFTIELSDNGTNWTPARVIQASASAVSDMRGTIELPGCHLKQGLGTAVLSTSLASNRSAISLTSGETMIQWRIDAGISYVRLATSAGTLDSVSVSFWGK